MRSPLCPLESPRESPHHFLVALHRTLLHYVVREPMIGSFQSMKKLQSLLSALGVIALGALIIGAIVFLLVDAILGGVL